MSEPIIRRRIRTVAITLSTATQSSTTINLGDVAGGVVVFGTMNTNSATLQCWGSDAENGTYGRLYGSDGSAADITLSPSSTQGRAYSLPDAVFALPYLRIVSGATNSTGTSGIVSLKS